MWAIQTTQLKKRFGDHWALAGLDLEVPKGTIFGLLGPNGAGKTTTFRILSTLTTATEGKAEILGFNVQTHPTEIQKRLGYLPQHPTFYKWMSALELLVFFARASGFSKQDATKRSEELLERVGLHDRKDDRIKGYSGGMMQRLGIAQALIHAPEILILDEPVSALDPPGRIEVFDLLHELREDHTILLSSHILEDLERMCDQVAFLRDGQVILSGDMESIHAKVEQHQSVSLLVEGTQAQYDAFIEEIDALPWISAVTTHTDKHERVKIELHTKEHEQAVDMLPSMVAKHTLRMWQLTISQPSLEGLFVQVMEGNTPS